GCGRRCPAAGWRAAGRGLPPGAGWWVRPPRPGRGRPHRTGRWSGRARSHRRAPPRPLPRATTTAAVSAAGDRRAEPHGDGPVGRSLVVTPPHPGTFAGTSRPGPLAERYRAVATSSRPHPVPIHPGPLRRRIALSTAANALPSGRHITAEGPGYPARVTRVSR